MHVEMALRVLFQFLSGTPDRASKIGGLLEVAGQLSHNASDGPVLPVMRLRNMSDAMQAA